MTFFIHVCALKSPRSVSLLVSNTVKEIPWWLACPVSVRSSDTLAVPHIQMWWLLKRPEFSNLPRVNFNRQHFKSTHLAQGRSDQSGILFDSQLCCMFNQLWHHVVPSIHTTSEKPPPPQPLLSCYLELDLFGWKQNCSLRSTLVRLV